jgi:uncharacterized protein (DUF4415 family)
MKKRKPTKKRRKVTRKATKIDRIRASAGDEQLLPEPAPEGRRYYKVIKKPVTLRLDADVLAWFKKQGRGYQTRINRALRKVMADER